MLLEIDRKVYNLTPAQNIKARRCPTATNLQGQMVIVTNKHVIFFLLMSRKLTVAILAFFIFSSIRYRRKQFSKMRVG